MPVPQEKLAELTELLVDQMLFEFRNAAAEGKTIDPRRLVACQKLLESANAQAFKPAAEYDAAGEPVKVAKVSVTDTPDHKALLARTLARVKLPFPTPTERLEEPSHEEEEKSE